MSAMPASLRSQSDPPDDTGAVRAPRDLRVAAIACGVAIAAATAGAYTVNAVWAPAGYGGLATLFFERQDAFWLVAIALLLCGVGLVRLPPACPTALTAIFHHRRTTIALLAV